ncbi:MAG: substrate-binding domain-containing protein [Clostridiales bacterium]|jgi:phosphate transport system substrate-binding protein|nr:substrate-binding domain-containing protein [Clostridiales bacterium]
MKKKFLPAALLLSLVTACSAGAPRDSAITVISREDGSGTRSAFIELFGVRDEDKNDNTAASAEITNNTGVMMISVAGDKNAIGYISLSALNDTVKVLKIEGVEATANNVSNGSYRISRPFFIAAKGQPSDAAQDFINFMLSADGQAVIEANGYVRVPDNGPFTSANASGKVAVAGSSSVTPAMEKLKEAYLSINSSANIEIQQSDSSTGMTAAIDGVCDIGMASRELKDSEIEKGLVAERIALDGLAVIVNQDNAIDDLSKEEVKSVYTGAITAWSGLNS